MQGDNLGGIFDNSQQQFIGNNMRSMYGTPNGDATVAPPMMG